MAVNQDLKVLWEEQTVKATPTEVLAKVHGVLNRMSIYPFKEPMVELANRIVKELGWRY